MTTNRESKRSVYDAAKAWTPKGDKRQDALKLAAVYGFNKRSKGTAAKGVVAGFFQELKNRRDLKSRVGADHIAAYSSTAKRLTKEVAPPVQKSAAEKKEKELAKKKEILKEVGLKKSAADNPSTREEIHKVNMARALDKSGEEALNAGAFDSGTGAAATVSAAEHKSAAEQMGLAPNFSMPHHEASKSNIEFAPSVAPPPQAKPIEAPAVEPAAKAKSASVTPPQEPGDASQAVGLPIS